MKNHIFYESLKIGFLFSPQHKNKLASSFKSIKTLWSSLTKFSLWFNNESECPKTQSIDVVQNQLTRGDKAMHVIWEYMQLSAVLLPTLIDINNTRLTLNGNSHRFKCNISFSILEFDKIKLWQLHLFSQNVHNNHRFICEKNTHVNRLWLQHIYLNWIEWNQVKPVPWLPTKSALAVKNALKTMTETHLHTGLILKNKQPQQWNATKSHVKKFLTGIDF